MMPSAVHPARASLPDGVCRWLIELKSWHAHVGAEDESGPLDHRSAQSQPYRRNCGQHPRSCRPCQQRPRPQPCSQQVRFPCYHHWSAHHLLEHEIFTEAPQHCGLLAAFSNCPDIIQSALTSIAALADIQLISYTFEELDTKVLYCEHLPALHCRSKVQTLWPEAGADSSLHSVRGAKQAVFASPPIF